MEANVFLGIVLATVKTHPSNVKAVEEDRYLVQALEYHPSPLCQGIE